MGAQNFSVAQFSTRLWSFEQDLAFYSKTGWGQVGVFLHKLEDPPFGSGMLLSIPLDMPLVDSAARKVRAWGLGVSHVCISGGWTDIENYSRHVAHTIWAMEATEKLGGNLLIVAPGRLNGLTYEEAFATSVQALKEVLRDGTTTVRLAIEPLRAWQLDFMNTFRESIELVHAVESDRFGVWVDVWHLGLEPDITDQIQRHGGHIFGVELSDAPDADPNGRVRVVPGDGVLPIEEVVGAIRATGYSGAYSLELAPALEYSPDNYPNDLSRSREYFLNLFDS